MKPVIVVAYDPQWVLHFETLAQTLLTRCGDAVKAIHHVGSTSVVGLDAKPIIDIDLEIDPDHFAMVKARLEAAGYTHEGDLGIPGREAFKTSSNDFPKHHLYVCATGSAELKRHLAFRDALRNDVALRDAYAAIKREAALQHPFDMAAYIEQKGVWIGRILEQLASRLLI